MTESVDQQAVRLAQQFLDDVPEGCALDTMAIRPTWAHQGTARAEMEIDTQHLNQVGVVQGGVYALYADAVAGWSAMSLLGPDKTFVTLNAHFNLLRAVRAGSVLRAEAEPVHAGGKTQVIGVRLVEDKDGRERVIAHFSCTQLVLDAS